MANEVERRPLLRRSEVPAYVAEKHGVPVAKCTLDKLASIGGGPPMRYFGRIPVYDPDAIDAWVLEKLSGPVRSAPQRKGRPQGRECPSA